MSSSENRKAEKQWLIDNWNIVVDMYPNQYIAVCESQMVCHGTTLERIQAQLDQFNSLENVNLAPVIIFVPPNAALPPTL
jgi:hypothetical protein|tara:strand:+ start:1756 stop:1995 length:240 start_codon:yes stop_codon:yes gene_type:complete